MRIRLNSNALVQFPRLSVDGLSGGAQRDCWWGDAAFAHRMRSLPQSIAAALYRDTQSFASAHWRMSSGVASSIKRPSFSPKRVLILSKITRFEFEKRVHSDIDDKQLESLLRRRGSDFNQLLAKHRVHHTYLQTIQSELERAGVESKVVQRFDYTEDAVNWADAVMAAGGDGTFLLAASRIHQRDKPVIGINTDPQGSEGYMCLMRKLPKEHFRSALQRLLDGDFHWLYRQRIRITLSGDAQTGVGDSVELHDQQLNRMPATSRWMDGHTPRSPSNEDALHNVKKSKKRQRSPPERVTMQLPVLALNEVFIGESLSSRVSYYEIQIDSGVMVKQKSSGIAICTGTGSTSWYFNINKLTEQCVSELLRITSEQCNESVLLALDESRPYIERRLGCPDDLMEGGVEDCLYLNLLQHKDTTGKLDTLLIFSNEELSETKLSALVSPSLNVIWASIRCGVLGSFNGMPYGVSDVVNAAKFLTINADILHVGKITVWAESQVAETVSSALNQTGISRAILINGNSKTRTMGSRDFSKRAAYKMATALECDLPSIDQSTDCLRTKSLSELHATVEEVMKSHYPFGDPFRTPSLEQPAIPTILGVLRQLPKGYPTDSNFDEYYQYVDFKRFLARLLPETQFKNAALLRRQVLHQYIHTQGDKKNTYFLFEQMKKILLDRDFIAPTSKLVSELRRDKNDVYLLEYGIDNPPTSCLQDGGWQDIEPFCDKAIQYFTRFATKGQPTKNSCEPTNPTWPAMGSTKRDYYVILKADGNIEWDSKFHLAGTQLWNNLLPLLDTLELKGRRDAMFNDETLLSSVEVEDDVQEWHRKAAEEENTESTEEDSLWAEKSLHNEL